MFRSEWALIQKFLSPLQNTSIASNRIYIQREAATSWLQFPVLVAGAPLKFHDCRFQRQTETRQVWTAERLHDEAGLFVERSEFINDSCRL